MACSTHKCGMKYSYLIWSITILLMILFIIDRFTMNLWPIHFHHTMNLTEDPWTEIVFYCFGFISGRILIISSSFIWLFQCRCIFNFFVEHKPKWLIVDDIMQENNSIHYKMGWLCIGIPILIHPWIVFLPLVQHYQFIIYYTWWRPIDSSTNFYLENVFHHKINVSINDLYALSITTFTFLIIFPLSMYPRFREKHWTISKYLHILGALIYGIELIRTPFTIHCWYISTPFIAIFLCDRIYGIYRYRKCNKTTIVGRYNFDNDYILLLLHVPNIYQYKNNKKGIKRKIGDILYLNTKKLGSCSLLNGWNPSHPFTTFYNHNNAMNMVQFTKSLRTSLGDESHKFPVLIHRDKKSVTYIELYPEEKYVLDRTASQSATIERWKYKMNQLHNKESSKSEIKQQMDISDSLENKKNRKLRIRRQIIPEQDSDDDDDDDDDEFEWNIGCIIKVHKQCDNNYNNRFTQHLQIFDIGNKDNSIITYGPYRSSFANIISELIEYRLDQIVNHNEFGVGSIVLIATGAGVSYIIGFVLWLRNRFDSDKNYVLLNEIRIHFSCRSIRLFQWVTDFLCERKYENLSIYAHFTSHENVCDYHEYEEKYDDQENEIDKLNENDIEYKENEERKKKKKKRNHAKIGRASFQDVLNNSPKHSTVFFGGHPLIQTIIKTICKELGFQFYEGHVF